MAVRKHYKILEARTPADLETLVNTWLDKREEWQVVGGIGVGQGRIGTVYFQAIKRQFRTRTKDISEKEKLRAKKLRKEVTDGS